MREEDTMEMSKAGLREQVVRALMRVGTMVVSSFVVVPSALAQGPLSPPGTPSPTMHTLEEIYNKVDDLAKNTKVFETSNTAYTPGTSNSTDTWMVPSGVSTILVECWGGGGGGGTMTGGGGGGYIAAKLTVTAGTTATLVMGAGGNFGAISTDGIIGGTTSFSLGGIVLQANGGDGGKSGDPATSMITGQASGGTYIVSGITDQFVGFNGSPGGVTKLGFMTAGPSDYAKVINFGDGGDAARLPGSGAKGGFRVISASINQIVYATQFGIQHGAGGGADAAGGFYGLGGRIIIHW